MSALVRTAVNTVIVGRVQSTRPSDLRLTLSCCILIMHRAYLRALAPVDVVRYLLLAKGIGCRSCDGLVVSKGGVDDMGVGAIAFV